MPTTTSTRCSTGSQKPTKIIVPEFVSSDWEACHAINAAGGIEMLPWQDGIMEGWLGINVFGRWAASVCGNDTPRQNGKTLGLVEPRCNYGMLKLGEQVLYTSHLQKTSTETFEDMANFWDTPKMRKHLKTIRTALGREQIILKDRRKKNGGYVPGGRIKFLARTRNGGRGQHGDLLVFDEALELSGESQASFLPAISASRNPQTIYVSTPPTPESDSFVFRRIRDEALSGRSSRTAWSEWSVDEIGDVRDRMRWYATNPSLGLLIAEDTIEGECDQMEPDRFARERLGWFCPVRRTEENTIFDPAAWDACATDDEPQGDVCYGVKLSPDGAEAALSACWKSDRPHFELVDYRDNRRGLGWLAEWLDARADKCAMLAVDGRNAEALTSRLVNYKDRQLHVMSTRDAIDAAALLDDGVKSGTVTHYGQTELDAQAKAATKRKVGRDAWCIGGEPSTAIESAADALWAARNAKYKPGRKAKIG